MINKRTAEILANEVRCGTSFTSPASATLQAWEDAGFIADVNNWVQTKDRLPDKTQDYSIIYICYLQHNFYAEHHIYQLCPFRDGKFECYKDYRVTHWQPLPPCPTTE